jgi:hypothetical protein
MVMVSQALDVLTSMSATAKLHTKKYMGECKFLFFTMAPTTKMFSKRLTRPRVRKTSTATPMSSHGDSLFFIFGPEKLPSVVLRLRFKKCR